ncbi:MAG: glycoside hydrolase family 28 protein, partial [Bacteroidales bacterium]|nr:glycoside hydrolase family 28 protein [Bacteroidales bacterium]
MTKKLPIIFILFALVCVNLKAQQVVRAPEAPFEFEDLVMYEFPAKEFPITKYGAKPGNVEATTQAFRKAMAACNKAGGGSVVVPEGSWITGPIHFQSNCRLYLSDGATLVFEDDPQLYLPAVKTSWEGTE